MVKVALAIAMIAAASEKTLPPGHTPGKMALDVSVECVSLLGVDLYSTPEAAGIAVEPLKRHLAEADKHVAAQPDNPAVHIERGRALTALWRYRDAVQAFTRAIALNPGDSGAYTLRGNAFLVIRLFDQAAADFEHAAALDGGNYDAWYGLGLAHFFPQRFEKAAAAFARAFNIAPDHNRSADAGELANIAAHRIGKDELKVVLAGEPARRAESDPFTVYLKSLNKRVNDEAGAKADWRSLADSKDWTQLGVIAAEAEIAAIEGSKKVKPSV